MRCSACGTPTLGTESECSCCFKPFSTKAGYRSAHFPARPETDAHVECALSIDPIRDGICPECRSKLAHREGCEVCPNGCWSACS